MREVNVLQIESRLDDVKRSLGRGEPGNRFGGESREAVQVVDLAV
jgi:hypothetical protein